MSIKIRDANINDARSISKLFYKLEIIHHKFDRTSSFDVLSEVWMYVDEVLANENIDVRVAEVNGIVCGYYVAINSKCGCRSIRIGRTAFVESVYDVPIHEIMLALLNDLYFNKHYDVCIAHNVYKINRGIVNMYLNELGFKILKTYKECSREKYVVVKYNK